MMPTIKANAAPGVKALSAIKGIDFDDKGIVLISDIIRAELGADCSVLMGANVANDMASDAFCETTIGYKDDTNGAPTARCSWAPTSPTTWPRTPSARRRSGTRTTPTARRLLGAHGRQRRQRHGLGRLLRDDDRVQGRHQRRADCSVLMGANVANDMASDAFCETTIG